MIPSPGEDFYLSVSAFKETSFPVVVKRKGYPDEKSISCIREVVTCNPRASLLAVKAQYTYKWLFYPAGLLKDRVNV